MELAKKINNTHQLERFSHISTAYVAGAENWEVVHEDELTEQYGFFTDYERSKYEGELLVQAAKTNFQFLFFALLWSLEIHKTGEIKTFNTFYFPLRLIFNRKNSFHASKRSLRINVVPVDYVAKAIAQLNFRSQGRRLKLSLCCAIRMLPKLGGLLDFVQEWAKNNLAVNLPRPYLRRHVCLCDESFAQNPKRPSNEK